MIRHYSPVTVHAPHCAGTPIPSAGSARLRVARRAAARVLRGHHHILAVTVGWHLQCKSWLTLMLKCGADLQILVGSEICGCLFLENGVGGWLNVYHRRKKCTIECSFAIPRVFNSMWKRMTGCSELSTASVSSQTCGVTRHLRGTAY